MVRQETRSFMANAEKTRGTGVNLVTGSSKKSASLRPEVHFSDLSGKPVVFISKVGTNPPSWTREDTPEVLYLPEKPEEARINGFFDLWGGSIDPDGLGCVSILFAGGMTAFPVMQRRRDIFLWKTALLWIPVCSRCRSTPLSGQEAGALAASFRSGETRETGKIPLLTSRNIWFDPSEQIVTDKIRVFIDRNNPQKYCPDLSFLPEIADWKRLGDRECAPRAGMSVPNEALKSVFLILHHPSLPPMNR